MLLLLGRDHKNVACLVDWWREDVKIKPQQTVSAPVLCFELAGFDVSGSPGGTGAYRRACVSD